MEPEEATGQFPWDFSGSKVIIVMGSNSDWKPCMSAAAAVLHDLGVPYAAVICSAHRTPDRTETLVQMAELAGVQVIIAGAGGAAHLPGMIAAHTFRIPVLGVPVQSRALNGLDSLLSIVQMPGGVPVGTLSIGESGARNAGILAATIVGLNDSTIGDAVVAYRRSLSEEVEWVPRD